MQSNNPVFRRSEEFQNGGNAYGNQAYSGGGAAYPGYGQGQQPANDYAQWNDGGTTSPVDTGRRMTIDSVVQSTGITLGVVLVAAFATWFLTPPITGSEPDVGPLIAAMSIGSLAAFALSMVNSFKRVVSVPLVLAFAVAEGIALGALSKFFDALFSTPDSGNIVLQAVLGTMAAFAGTLAAYKFFDIKVGQKFRTFVIAAVFGMIGLSLMELVLGMFNNQLGLFGFGALGMLTAIVGLVLGVFMLILDFDFVEQGIANGIPERESWRAAFAMTVSLVWIYTNLLRLLAILNQD
ncbi:Bax inhibitor-1/YccA family protein [Nocardioides sp. SYSU D00038]|uniref:Bax inhibitor-1/YccA family protein n=1 Tax=Nocardioides sp. SYSU D00038 TaxID=2812554 RepID=UPI00196845B5|nr:Bax inhibitor-1/YccA family protein [Nocardioides sp. SYSU D00038]